jgi:hypothetical protein
MFVSDLFKSRSRLEAENLFLRHQLSIALQRAPPRLRLRGIDRVLFAWMIKPSSRVSLRLAVLRLGRRWRLRRQWQDGAKMLPHGQHLSIGLEQRRTDRRRELVLPAAAPPERNELRLARNGAVLRRRMRGRGDAEGTQRTKDDGMRHRQQGLLLSVVRGYNRAAGI